MKTYKQKAKEAERALEAEKAAHANTRNVLAVIAREYPDTRDAIMEMVRPRYAEFQSMDGRVFYVRTG